MINRDTKPTSTPANRWQALHTNLSKHVATDACDWPWRSATSYWWRAGKARDSAKSSRA